MLTLTRKTDYALVAMVELVKRGDEKASARQIAEKYQLPLPMLMNILKELMNAGLVHSTRGAQGGYKIARSSDQITLADLIRAVEGPVMLTLCCQHHDDEVDKSKCNIEEHCPTKEPIKRVHNLFEKFLEQVTLSHIAFNDVPQELNTEGILGNHSQKSARLGTAAVHTH